jgi:hypothetical protein
MLATEALLLLQIPELVELAKVTVDATHTCCVPVIAVTIGNALTVMSLDTRVIQPPELVTV